MGECRVFALDLPGHGKSGGIGEQTIGGYAKIVADWLIDIGIARAVFVGHSMGGAITQTLALEFPDLVRGIVLVGTGPKLPVNPDLLEKLSVPSAYPKAVELIVKWSFSKGAEEKLRRQAKETMMKTRPTVVYGDFVACSHFDVTKRLKDIETPTLVICGEEDKMTPITFSEALRDQIPGAALTTVEGAGHMVMVEKSNQVAAAVQGFLTDKIK
jgi:pimeloyl-ACP methyl ester carboxylesterase